MKLYFRIADNGKTKIKMAKNTIFKSKEPKMITICPLPSFLKGAKCGCGKNAKFMFKNMSTFICNGCFEKNMENCTKLVKEEDVSIPITRTTILRLKFEWSINERRWYTVYGRNLRPKNWEKFLLRIRDMIISGKLTLFDGEYKREYKELVIY